MTWHSEGFLWLLLLLLPAGALWLWQWRTRQASTRRFGATAPALIRGRSGGLRAARAVLWLLGTMLLIVALARPQLGSRSRLLHKRGVDVVVALDFSKSMLAEDVRPSRIERAKAELSQLFARLAGDRVGLVGFAGETIEFPMTVDHAAAMLFLRGLDPYDMPVGGTAIARALEASKHLLERSADELPPDVPRMRSRAVVLITDGEDHVGDPAKAARALAETDTKLFVVGVGTADGEPIPTHASDGTRTGYLKNAQGERVLTALTPSNEAQLRELAELTDGAYFRAQRGRLGLEPVRRALRKMKQQELEARRVTVHEERYALVLLPAFLLLVLEALLPHAWWRREEVER